MDYSTIAHIAMSPAGYGHYKVIVSFIDRGDVTFKTTSSRAYDAYTDGVDEYSAFAEKWFSGEIEA